MEKLYYLLPLIPIGILFAIYRRWKNNHDYEALMAEYAQKRKPIIVHSMYPGDPTVKPRAKKERELLVESGNRFGKGQGPVPVYEFVYRQVDGKGGGEHTDWNHFLEDLGEFAKEYGRKHGGMVLNRDENEAAMMNGQHVLN